MKCEDHAHPSAAPGRTPLNASGHSRAEYSNASIHGPTVAEAHLAELRVGPLVRLAPGGALGSLRSAASDELTSGIAPSAWLAGSARCHEDELNAGGLRAPIRTGDLRTDNNPDAVAGQRC